MIWIASLNLASAIVGVGWLHHRGGKLLPEIDLAAARIEKAELIVFLKKGLAFLMSPARQAIHAQGMIFVTRIALGPEAVVLIATLRTIGNTLAQASLGINATIFPELQHAIATSRDEDARRIYRFGTGLSIFVGLAGCAAISLFGPHVYHAWTTGKLDPPQYAWVFLLLGAFVPTVWCAAGCTFRAVNRPEASGVVGILTACIGVGLSAILVGPMGVNGVLLGLLVMETLMGAFVLPATCKIIGQPLARLPADVFALRQEIFAQLRRTLRRRSKRPAEKPAVPTAEDASNEEISPAHYEGR
jgi:O-antigen/teichoic acid export membrane protein